VPTSMFPSSPRRGDPRRKGPASAQARTPGDPSRLGSRQAIAIGLGFVAVLSLAAIPPGALVFPALAIAVLVLAPVSERRRPMHAATASARLRAVVLPSTADALLWMALGAAIGLVYLIVVLQL
jgi:hypothetical protein